MAQEADDTLEDKSYNAQQIDRQLTEMSETTFEVKVETQEDVRNFDVIEAIEENYGAALTEKNVSADSPCRNMVFNSLKKEVFENQNGEKINSFIIKILVRNNDAALAVINDWKAPNNFDDLAFRNSMGDRRQVRVTDVKIV